MVGIALWAAGCSQPQDQGEEATSLPTTSTTSGSTGRGESDTTSIGGETTGEGSSSVTTNPSTQDTTEAHGDDGSSEDSIGASTETTSGSTGEPGCPEGTEGGSADDPGSRTAVMYVGAQQQIGYPISFDGSDSTGIDPYGLEDPMREWIWEFGDGTCAERGEYLTTITHVYTQPGTYTTRLTVVYDSGIRTTTEADVEVLELPRTTVSGSTVSAIQAAIDALGGEPGIVEIPAGEYTLADGVSIPGGTIVEGAGMDQTKLTITFGGYGLNADGDNVRVTGIELTGDGDFPHGLVAYSQKNLYVDHSEFHHLNYANALQSDASGTYEYNVIHDQDVAGAGYGIVVTTGSYLMARYNEFYRNRHSVAGSGGNYDLLNSRYDVLENRFHDEANNQDVQVDMHPSGHGRLRISDNLFEDAPYGLGLKDGWGEANRNTFRNITGYVIKLRTPTHNGNHIPEAGAYNFELNDNVIEDNVSGSPHYGIEDGHDPIWINCRMVDIPYSGEALWDDCP